jgi:hypothetical protein
MHLSCNAPLYLWDEFLLTTLYLSTLTASRAAKGQTPYELWFGCCPSLSHLREIGCCAYVLISGANPKIAAKSVECTLIRYASSAKAYRCWHRESGRIMDLFHVTFVEHLNCQLPVLLLSTDTSTTPTVRENASVSSSTDQPFDNSSPLDGVPSLSAPKNVEMDVVPRRSAQNRVPAPSQEDSNDSLVHGRAATRVLEQVCKAASWNTEAKANAKRPPPDVLVEEGLLTEATGDTPEEAMEDLEPF